MKPANDTQAKDEIEAGVAAARAGDESAFARLVERHRRELQVHCYRMLGSFDEAEDAVQETFLRAWRGREAFAGRSTFRAWLYRIATNTCLDALERRPRRPVLAGSPGGGSGAGDGGFEVPWLQPYPDRLLDGVAPPESEPDAVVAGKETIELAFLVAIQHLPPRQRAVLIMRGILGWSTRETAELLETTVASVNSALQRARATLRERLPARRAEWAPEAEPTEAERVLLARYVEATENADSEAFIELMHEDARFAMPPEPEVWVGAETIVGAWRAGGFGTPDFGEMRCVTTRANRQPAVACYVRKSGDDGPCRPLALDVLRIEEGRVAEIVTFPPDVFGVFELPPEL
ncbi:MAG TPA: sigma-70 family RNA polymerase sigma factor [Solirubrobacterales bacterium]|nr:sigma-70 family RNA polymerase sigma factor [Solirubrobacterales bacterium]